MFPRKTLLILSVLSLAVATTLFSTAASPPFQTQEPRPPAEAKGPIIAMAIASSIDAKGKIVNPTFTFTPNEPQITAIVYVGKVNVSQLKITWYKTSENGDEKLFEHQVQVKSYERAFSVAKNASGTLELGTYKVVATLAGQTEETEFDVSPPKQQKKTSSRPHEELFEDQAQSPGLDRAFSAEMNTRELLVAGPHERVVAREAQMQKVAWNASSLTTRSSTSTSQTGQQGKRPVAGTSGTAPASQPPRPSRTAFCDAAFLNMEGLSDPEPKVNFDGSANDSDADRVQVTAIATCYQDNLEANFVLTATVNGPPQPLGSLEGTTGNNVSTFFINPCSLPGGSDLPGTKVSVRLSPILGDWDTAKATITLGNDTLAPRVKVVSTPVRGSVVKAGDKINLQVTAQEKRRNGPWQTGVQSIWLSAMPEGWDKDKDHYWINPSPDPKPCSQKTWEQSFEATYTVPNNPPPTIKLCARAVDYAGSSREYASYSNVADPQNPDYQCVEFYTIPEGKNNVMPANCKVKGYAKLGFIDAAPLLGSFDPQSPNRDMISCNFRWTICGKEYIKTKVVKNGPGVCSSFFIEAEATLPKEAFCCDCYPKCRSK